MKTMLELNLSAVSNPLMKTHIWLESCGWSGNLKFPYIFFRVRAHSTLLPPFYDPHDSPLIYSVRNALINEYDTVKNKHWGEDFSTFKIVFYAPNRPLSSSIQARQPMNHSDSRYFLSAQKALISIEYYYPTLCGAWRAMFGWEAGI